MNDSKKQASPILSYLLVLAMFLLAIAIFIYHSPFRESAPHEAPSAFDSLVYDKWGKYPSQLPLEHLIILTPHNVQTRENFGDAFFRYYALEHGKRILIWWQSTRGSNAILEYIPTEPSKESSIKADVIFGGGQYVFEKLAEAGRLAPLELPEEVLAEIPSRINSLDIIDPQRRWCCNVLSSFGFLYNKQKIEEINLTTLTTWNDLASPLLFDNIILADPSVSGSTMMAFEMVLQSGPDWPSGWESLLSILSNTRSFVSNSDDAANAPLFDQAAATICIDFFGISRAVLQPNKLVFVSPKGETVFTPDPIAILKNAPNPEAAKAFVSFLLSINGQKLWGLDKTADDSPSLSALYRSPVRKDFYTEFSNELPQWTLNPYESGSHMDFDPELRSVRYPVLIELIKAAVIDNFEPMKVARKKMIEQKVDFASMQWLPENVDTLEEIRGLSVRFKDLQEKELITAAWHDFYKQKYQHVLESSPN